MNEPRAVFIDANVFVYLLDETSQHNEEVVEKLQGFVENQIITYTSQHVLEEVLFTMSKLVASPDAVDVSIQRIASIVGLRLVEPALDFEFTKRYAQLYTSSSVGLNDCLLLQIMLDAGIPQLFSYDKKFTQFAKTHKVGSIA